MSKVKFRQYIVERNEFKEPVNEVWGIIGTPIVKWLAKQLVSSAIKYLGDKMVATFGETFRRSDGSYGSGVRFINSAGDMIRINTEDERPNRSIIVKMLHGIADIVDFLFTFGLARCIRSVDYWKPSNNNIYKPDYTCEISYIGDMTQFVTNPGLTVSIIKFLTNGKFGEYSLGQGKDGVIKGKVEKGRLEQNEAFKKIEKFADSVSKGRKSMEDLMDRKGVSDELWEQLDVAGYSHKAIERTAEFLADHPEIVEKGKSVKRIATKIGVACHLIEHNPDLNDNQIELVADRFSDCLE